MKFLKILRESLCEAFLATSLTRQGKWKSALRLVDKK